MSKKIEMVGLTFGKVKIVKFDRIHITKSGQPIPYWFGECQGCFTVKSYRGPILRMSPPKFGCGCLKPSPTTEHPLYNAWESMRARCLSKINKDYPRYGGSGIKMCDRWETSFLNFAEDMGAKPNSKSTVDRIDNDKGYSKENCRWASRKEQARNRKDTVIIRYKGFDLARMNIAKILNISSQNLGKKLLRYSKGNLHERDLRESKITFGIMDEMIKNKLLQAD